LRFVGAAGELPRGVRDPDEQDDDDRGSTKEAFSPGGHRGRCNRTRARIGIPREYHGPKDTGPVQRVSPPRWYAQYTPPRPTRTPKAVRIRHGQPNPCRAVAIAARASTNGIASSA